jgi:hypothetical protein
MRNSEHISVLVKVFEKYQNSHYLKSDKLELILGINSGKGRLFDKVIFHMSKLLRSHQNAISLSKK